MENKKEAKEKERYRQSLQEEGGGLIVEEQQDDINESILRIKALFFSFFLCS